MNVGAVERGLTLRYIPRSKLLREIGRALRQLANAPKSLLLFALATPYHDLVLARRQRVSQGEMALSERVAVYLIFPKRGISTTHLQSVHYLASSGYSPVIVSNCRLSENERAKLLPFATNVIERENFGYDFGGYRDALLWLVQHKPQMERLVLLNDSTWFPLPGASDWLIQSEALGVDFAAATWTGAVRRPAPWNYDEIDWRVDKSRRNFHYASYALAFSHRVLADPNFLRFWRTLRLTQEKNRTVRRGEIGLTSWVIERGYSHGATVELNDLAEKLISLSAGDLERMFNRLIVYDDAEMETIKAGISPDWVNSPNGRLKVEKFIQAVVARRGVVYALADYLVRELQFPFLKKSPALAGGAAARISASLIRDLAPATGGEILVEIGANYCDARRSSG